MVLLLILVTAPVDARLSAEVDRREVALGETLRLTLRGDDGEDPDDVDLTPLSANFVLLQRSSSTNASLINGSGSVIRTLEIEMEPLREGLMVIPSFSAGGRQTTPIAIKVKPRQVTATDDARVQFSAQVDLDEAYVQQQVILTVTLAQSVNLDARTVSELNIPDAVVEQLEQRSFQRRQSGRLWQVTELRYAIFPQKSGSLEIPPITFSGRELIPGRSLLGARLGNRTLLETTPIRVAVKPVPTAFTGDVWLPASALELRENWSSNPGSLSVGDSTTRTIEIVARGLQGSQIPPLTSFGDTSPPPGLRFYPDTETIDDREVTGGIEGFRVQSEALVSTDTGSWQLPAIELPWWNTETDQMEIARLPGRSVSVAGPAGQTPTGTEGAASVTETAENTTLLWQGVAAAGWFLVLLLGAWVVYLHKTTPNPGAKTRPTPKQNLVALRLACQNNDTQAARTAVLKWSQDHFGDGAPATLAEVGRRCSPNVQEQLRALDAALYRVGDDDWSGQALFAAIRDERAPADNGSDSRYSLYPT
ncbi:hypothetical protein NOR51B_1704 [Luminiphilus syltensis NOR5-1B]|uniref:DUF7939 domain-containing protein n=1 Tax=Luminiphilus syltensis NOR5-1B TaxID=565045 RepID=B8KXW6_9GAMM|nr:hypothetical protein NOR51B_1704 [Luminiphilus syltensis NOR5-1B]